MSSSIDAPIKDADIREAMIAKVFDCADRIQMDFSNSIMRDRILLEAVQDMDSALTSIKEYMSKRK